MATPDEQLDKKKPREILGLNVKELSMVDRPAILREFLLLKRREDDSMGAFAETETTDPVIEGMKWTEVDVEKALPIDLRNAIKAVIPWLKKNAGMEGAPKDEIGRVVAFLGKVEGGQYPEPAAKAKEDDMTDDERKKKEEEDKAKEEKAKKAVEDGKCPKCGAELKDGACTKCEFKVAAEEDEEKKKAADDKKKKDEEEKAKEEEKKKAASPLSLVLHPDGRVDMMGDVTKGASQFTTQRTEAIKSSVGQLLTLLAKVDADAAKSVIDELVKSTLPADVKWTPGTTATPASVKKSVEDGIATALEPLTKALSDLGIKVETIEKARPASQSYNDENTTTEKVNKGDNPWGGLPLG